MRRGCAEVHRVTEKSEELDEENPHPLHEINTLRKGNDDPKKGRMRLELKILCNNWIRKCYWTLCMKHLEGDIKVSLVPGSSLGESCGKYQDPELSR